MNVSTSSEQSWLSKTKKNNLANNSLMVLVTPQLRLFSAFGIKQIHQSSGLQKKSQWRKNCSTWLLSSALRQLATASDHYLITHHMHSLHSQSSPSSNITFPPHSLLYSTHQGLKLSPFPWSQPSKYPHVKFVFFLEILWFLSNFQAVFKLFFPPPPIKSAVTEADFSKMLCFLHVCPTWTWKNVGWILDILRNHPITVKAANLQTLVHSHCPHTI